MQRMKSKASSSKFIPFDNYRIIRVLEQGDQFFYKKKLIKGTEPFKWVLCVCSYKPVFFKYSYNWTIRAMFKIMGKEMNEYFYVNDKTIADYRFDPSVIRKWREYQLNKQLKIK